MTHQIPNFLAELAHLEPIFVEYEVASFALFIHRLFMSVETVGEGKESSRKGCLGQPAFLLVLRVFWTFIMGSLSNNDGDGDGDGYENVT